MMMMTKHRHLSKKSYYLLCLFRRRLTVGNEIPRLRIKKIHVHHLFGLGKCMESPMVKGIPPGSFS